MYRGRDSDMLRNTDKDKGQTRARTGRGRGQGQGQERQLTPARCFLSTTPPHLPARLIYANRKILPRALPPLPVHPRLHLYAPVQLRPEE